MCGGRGVGGWGGGTKRRLLGGQVREPGEKRWGFGVVVLVARSGWNGSDGAGGQLRLGRVRSSGRRDDQRRDTMEREDSRDDRQWPLGTGVEERRSVLESGDSVERRTRARAWRAASAKRARWRGKSG